MGELNPMKMPRANHGSRPDPRVGSRGFHNCAGRTRSGLEVFEISRVGSLASEISRIGSDRVGSGRVGSGHPGRVGSDHPGPSGPARTDAVHEKP